MKRFAPIFLLIALLGFCGPALAQDQNMTVCLVTAEGEKAGKPNVFVGLGKYQPIIAASPFAPAFETFTMAKQGAAPVKKGFGNVNFGGMKFEIRNLKPEGKNLKGEVLWTNNGKTIVRADYLFEPGAPCVIGGPKISGGRMMIVVVAVE